MKSLLAVLVLISLVLPLQAQTKKPAVKPAAQEAAKPAPAAEKPVVPKASEVLIEGFESAALSNNCRGMTFIAAAEGGQEQTAEDKLTFELAGNPKVVRSGKQSMKVQYKMNPAAPNKFANISINSKVPMGGNKAVSFWINKIEGKASITVTAFDDTWKKGVTQTIPLKDGPALYEFAVSDFTTGFSWQNVKTIQIILKGEAAFYIDDVRFVPALSKK